MSKGERVPKKEDAASGGCRRLAAGPACCIIGCMERVELLAPARDLCCGQVAIDSGADAVYLGAPRFGARQKAGNSLQDIAALVAHAHTYWARVYVTVNTLLYDDELPQAVRLIHELYDLGVDAVIIQDVGLLESGAPWVLPPIALIASTQMHNHTPERVAFLEEVGFRRAILARELSLEQIRAIRARTSLELECFVHGALCTGYSGQCYLSYAIGGRSGNRGECAQPCRRKYSLVDADGRVLEPPRHLLSLRDLALDAELGALLDAGVTSFKIEGRLKDAAYVKNVVSWYRQQLDNALAERGLARASSGHSHAGFRARRQQDVQPRLHDPLFARPRRAVRGDRLTQDGGRAGGPGGGGARGPVHARYLTGPTWRGWPDLVRCRGRADRHTGERRRAGGGPGAGDGRGQRGRSPRAGDFSQSRPRFSAAGGAKPASTPHRRPAQTGKHARRLSPRDHRRGWQQGRGHAGGCQGARTQAGPGRRDGPPPVGQGGRHGL